MDDKIIIQKAIEEIENKNWGVTEQLLQIHQVVYENGIPKALTLHHHSNKDAATVYFQIKDERFYLAIYLDTKPHVDIRGVATQPYHSIYFSASSDDLDFDQLCALTILGPAEGWSKGDKKRHGNTIHSHSKFMFEAHPGPYDFDTKLNLLLDALETDKQGVQRMINIADGYIQVATVFHNGNTMLGGHHLSRSAISRLARLNLEIDFDEYAEGNSFVS